MPCIPCELKLLAEVWRTKGKELVDNPGSDVYDPTYGPVRRERGLVLRQCSTELLRLLRGSDEEKDDKPTE